jgi:indolepyruvate ferredoxin oxidoreductase, alpha subunit
VLDMGASVSFAEALARVNPDRPVIASIGDSTFFHSGITPLINAVAANATFVLAILDNSTTAMTGFQPVPHLGNKISIEKIIDGIGISFNKVIDPYDIDASIALVKEAYKSSQKNKSPSVVIFRHPCVTKEKIRGKHIVRITERCKNCRICYEKFECPALYEDRERNRADVRKVLCTGCLVCVDICPFSAIEEDANA